MAILFEQTTTLTLTILILLSFMSPGIVFMMTMRHPSAFFLFVFLFINWLLEKILQINILPILVQVLLLGALRGMQTDTMILQLHFITLT